MPLRVQIEARVLAAFDTVKSGCRVEDSLVELKAEWPDSQRAARRLAGHANSARGEGILWLVGLDESKGVQPFNAVDLAEWWPQVQSGFNGATPALTDILVHTEDGPVLALFFDTSPGPFVVKNAVFGSPGGGPVQYEVPWRDGTGVRSATRSDLIRLLMPVVRLPAVEVLSATARLWAATTRATSGELPDDVRMSWHLRLELYVTPEIGTVVVFPVHRTTIEFMLGNRAYVAVDANETLYSAPSVSTFGTGAGLQSVSDTASVQATSSEAIIHLPGRVFCRSKCVESVCDTDPDSPIRLKYSVHPTHSERSIQLEVELTPAPPDRDGALNWAFGSAAGWRI